jgi:hypothetical protein
VAGQLNHNPVTKPVCDSEEWNDTRTADDKVALCKKCAREVGLGTVDPEGKRTCRNLKAILGDFRTGNKMLSDNAELSSDPHRVTATDIEYGSKSCEAFDIHEPVFVKHLFGEDALQLSTKGSDDPPSSTESDSKAKAEAEAEYGSNRQPEGADGAMISWRSRWHLRLGSPVGQRKR